MHKLWTVLRKELLELSRDRRTLIFTILMPTLIMPVLMAAFGFATAMMMKKAQDEELSYALFGAEHAPALVQRLAQTKGFRRVELDSQEAIRPAIKDERIRFALVIPADFQGTVLARRQAAVEFHYNSAVSIKLLEKRVKDIVGGYGTELRQGLYSELGLKAEQQAFAETPVRLVERSTADEREDLGEKLGGLLPYILFFVCLTGAMYPAIDLGAGEKERGTLETLLLAPLPRGQLVLAKFSVLFLSGLTAALLSVTSLGLWLVFFGQAMAVGVLQKILGSLGLIDFLLLVLMLAPLAAIYASLLLSLSIYAKSFKEAQSYMSPLVMLMIVPIVASLLPGVELNWAWALVPITNIALAMKELLKGTVDYAMLAVILGSTTVLAGALLAFCRWWFSREEVLFRS
ncbi:MAG: ABC transporter permease [Gammaproteobacteria bacterium]|nr:ABC transporter permease [Gammaproteobacteria bacterium]